MNLSLAFLIVFTTVTSTLLGVGVMFHDLSHMYDVEHIGVAMLAAWAGIAFCFLWAVVFQAFGRKRR